MPVGDYVLFGSTPMLAHGLIARVGDIDIVARGGAWAKAVQLGEVEEAPGKDSVVRLDGVDIFNGWMGWDVDALLGRAVSVDGFPYASLTDVLAFKRELNRPKDEAHIKLLEDFVAR